FRDATKPLVGYAQKLTLHGRSWCGLGRASERLPSKREIKFTKSCRSRRNPLKSSKLQHIEANRFFFIFRFLYAIYQNFPAFVLRFYYVRMGAPPSPPTF